jgi:hypothetical protein
MNAFSAKAAYRFEFHDRRRAAFDSVYRKID